jgi:hypothetical protein
VGPKPFCMRNDINSCLCRNPNIDLPAHSLVTTLTELSKLVRRKCNSEAYRCVTLTRYNLIQATYYFQRHCKQHITIACNNEVQVSKA